MNMILSRFLAVWLGLLVGLSAQGAATQARLVLPVASVKAGETITVGVLLEMPSGWHTYWKNPGESGMASKITWTLPEGITAGDIQWPTPEMYEAEGFTTYVHHDQAMLLVPLTIGANAKGDVELKAKVSWLECEKLCVPGKSEVNAILKISAETKPSADADQIKKWQDKLPKANATLKPSVHWDGDAKDGKRNLIIEFTPEANHADWDFFPYRGEGYSVSSKSEKLGLKEGKFTLRKTVSSDEGKWPAEIKGLLVGGSKTDKPTVAYETMLALAADTTALPDFTAFNSTSATRARLVLPAEAVKAGDTITAGVLLEMPPRWHTYWKNAGESGEPTKITWTLPAGVTAAEIGWPVPQVYEAAGLTTFAFHNEAMLLVPLTFATTLPAGELKLAAKVDWLECETDKSCVKGGADVTASIVIAATTKPSAEAGLIEKWRAKLPRPNEALKTTAQWEGEAKQGKRSLLIKFTPTSDAVDWDFFPHRTEGFTVGAKSEKLGLQNNQFVLRKTVTANEGKWPTEISGLIVGGNLSAKPAIAYESRMTISNAEAATSFGPVANPRSLLEMLFYAFIGGLILNIMPCVLPVISLKILGFVKQSQEDPGRVRTLGLIYALGVIVSFLVLAGLVIAVQQAGKNANWGMQFQNPQFLVILTILVTLVALNLFGVFEVTMNDNVMGAAGQLATKKGPAGAFFNGVLATILATPCTAPFLGTALGFAFSQTATIILLVFVFIALGLAFPYVLLSWQPKWLKFLPKPGAWMERFKILMGFPMLATAFWLFSVAVGHFGRSGVLWLGLLMVFVGLSAYIFGEFVQRGSKHRGIAGGLAALLLIGSLGYVLEGQLNWRSPKREGTTTSVDVAESKGGIAWKAWSAAAVEEARKSGKPVFVDFTADWCVTCQANKKTSIEIASVKEKLSAIGAVSFLGDFTYEDPVIAAELKKYGRAGVPLVIVFPADPQANPIVLPELLTPGIVLEALDKVAPKQLTVNK